MQRLQLVAWLQGAKETISDGKLPEPVIRLYKYWGEVGKAQRTELF